MKSDIEIAQEAKMKPIADIAASLGLADEDVIPYGRYKAKVNHRLIHKASKQGKLILVTAISPTPAGEGKTTTSVGLADAMNAPMTASVQWMERTLDDSANRRISLPEGFLCADAVLRLCQNVTNGLHVNEKIVDRAIREYLPFLATENIMMEAVKRGGDRQALHEKIRQHSMAATARMKEGESCDLLDRLAADPAFGMTRAELDAVMEPSLYIGRCKEQVERLLAEYAPLLTDAQTADGAISL